MKYFIRSPNGFGCIKKLQGNRYRPYVFLVTINGKQRPMAYFTNYKDASIYRAEYIAKNKDLAHIKEVCINPQKEQEIQRIIKAEIPNIPLFKDVYAEWLPKHKQRNNVSLSTLNSYKNAFRHCKLIQNMPINTIKFNDLQSILDGIGEQNLSYSTKKKVRNLMSLVFQYAAAMDYVDKDYVSLLDIGKNEKIRPHVPFTEQEIQVIWEHQHESFYDKILILLYTGMRVGELLNLLKTNINIDERFIHITKSKTAAGIRYVPIHSCIMKFVKLNLEKAGDYFISNNGNKFSYTAFCFKWRKAMQKCNLSHTTHDCRHTVASRLDTANANEIAKRRILGHAQQNVTEGYTHKTLTELIKTIELLT